MKNYLNYLSLLIITVVLYGCGPQYNGHSEKEFEASKKIVGQKLSKAELANQEKALLVIVGESMRLKWVESAKYKGQSFNTIALKLIDGHTYSSLVSKAEDILKAENERKAAGLTAEIDSLEKKRSADVAIKNQIASLFRVDSLALEKIDWFGTQTPQLDIDYLYMGKQPLHGKVEVSIKLYQAGQPQAIVSQNWIQGSDTSKLEPGGSVYGNIVLSQLTEKEPQKWNALKYPLINPDLKSLGLRLEVQAVQFTLNGKHIVMPEADDTALAEQINKDKADLKAVQSLKGTLDELELTDTK